jgi:[acyl-carrier-protein] S-malonyltransferase
VAALFDGQGVQERGMGHDIYGRFGVARETFAAASQAVGVDMARVCFGNLVYLQKDTRIAQPAIATVNLAEYRAWCELNEREADVVTGLSKGLYSCLPVAGMIESNSNAEADAKAVELISKRAEIMYQNAQQNPGGMAAVLGKLRHEIAAMLPEGLKFGVSRGDKHFILTGPKDQVVRFLQEHGPKFGERRARSLDIDQAAHHPIQQGTVDELRDELDKVVTLGPNKIFIGNGPKASRISSAQQAKEHLLAQMTEEAMWDWTIKQLVIEGVKTAIEFGPDKKRGLLRDISRVTDIQTVKFPAYENHAANPLQNG